MFFLYTLSFVFIVGYVFCFFKNRYERTWFVLHKVYVGGGRDRIPRFIVPLFDTLLSLDYERYCADHASDPATRTRVVKAIARTYSGRAAELVGQHFASNDRPFDAKKTPLTLPPFPSVPCEIRDITASLRKAWEVDPSYELVVKGSAFHKHPDIETITVLDITYLGHRKTVGNTIFSSRVYRYISFVYGREGVMCFPPVHPCFEQTVGLGSAPLPERVIAEASETGGDTFDVTGEWISFLGPDREFYQSFDRCPQALTDAGATFIMRVQETNSLLFEWGDGETTLLVTRNE